MVFVFERLSVEKIVMYIHEIVDGLCGFKTVESSHGFESLSFVLMISFDAVVVVFAFVFSACYRYAKGKVCCISEIFVVGFFVAFTSIADDVYFHAEFLPVKKLVVAVLLHVSEEFLRSRRIVFLSA